MNAATMTCGSEGVFHGMKSYFCQNEFGQIAPVYSISAGLDYPGVGPEHAYLHDIGRAQYVPVTDDQAVDAFEYIARTEGIICAIESAHAVAYAMELAPKMDKDQIMIVNLSGRGDKDVAAIARYRGSIYMNKNIASAFENKKAFIGFVTAGDPDLDTSRQILLEMAKNGCDLIEVGIPFSDPIAEGR